MIELGTEIGIGFDMHGCPNRCAHCWIPDDGGVREQMIRRVVDLFRKYVPAGASEAAFRKVSVSTAIREPDFSDDYRRLYGLECELSDGKPCRYELLSVWRLARNPGYASWAKAVGPDACQITFFGEEATTDRFCGRKGAFRDALAATEALLHEGMRPRWQLFLNTVGIGEFGSLMRRVDDMRLRQRVEALGGAFEMFSHPWSPNGLNLAVEHLRPQEQDMEPLPRELVERSRKHFGTDRPWASEEALLGELAASPPPRPYGLSPGHMPWFLVTGSLDVYHNACGMDPWWRLGNIGREDVGTIVGRLLTCDTPGLRLVHEMPPRELARMYGQPRGKQVFSCVDDLLSLYSVKHFAAGWGDAAYNEDMQR